MQNIKFESITDFFEYLPDNELQVVKSLRSLVLGCMPDCQEKLSYNVPYYYRFKRVCFIWPSAVPWGKVKLNGVLLGFCQGNLLPNELEFLDKGERKQVYTKTFMSTDEVYKNQDIIKTYLLDAVIVDDELKKSKLKSQKS